MIIPGILLVFGILFLVIGAFFWFPELGSLFYVQSSSQNDLMIKKQYRTLALKLLVAGILFIIIGSYLIYQG